VQVLAEALRSRTVYQMWPAVPSVPWTEPARAEASQRPVTGWPPDGLAVEDAVADPAPDGDLVAGGAVVPPDPGAGDGPVVVEWALQPVTATAAANTTVAMILAGRMVVPPEQATLEA
jgi:hypothetical protein